MPLLTPASITASRSPDEAAAIRDHIAQAKQWHASGMNLLWGRDAGHGDYWTMTDMIQGEFKQRDAHLRKARRIKKAGL